jgi:Fe-S cluster assembly protein SufB
MAGTWSYDPALVDTNTVDALRLEVADTDPGAWLLANEEYQHAILVEATYWGAAARCSEYIARLFLRRVDVKLGRAMQIAYCLPFDSLVFTENGPRKIGTIEVGERVWSHDGERFESRKVIGSGQTGTDHVITIKTTNRTIRANATHPILVRRLNSVKGTPSPDAVGHQRSGQSRWILESEHTYVPAGEIRRGDVLCVLDRLPAMSGTAKAHEESVEMMEFYGLYMGDGNITKGRIETPWAVSISRADSATYMGPYRETMSKFSNRRGVVTLEESHRRTKVSSQQVAQSLIDLGFGGGAHTKRVPGWVFLASEALRLGFLRGFLDADGTVGKNGTIAFALCNQGLLNDVRHLCMSVGVPVTNTRESNRLVKLPNGDPFQSRMFWFACSDVFANMRISSHTPHYVERMEEAAAARTRIPSTLFPFGGGKTSTPPEGITYSRVRSVEIGETTEAVYDIEVEGNHNFIADGVVVHNSKMAQQYLDMAVKLRTKSMGAYVPYIGGQFVADKQALQNDPLLVESLFSLTMGQNPWVGGYSSDSTPPVGNGPSPLSEETDD